MSAFLIDARFLLRNTTDTFWGAPLIVVDNDDQTFCFGFMRDLLRVRRSLHISAGAVVFGSDANAFATEKDVRSAIELCRKLSVVVINEPKLPILAIVAAHVNRFSNIVTDDHRMLYFCTEKCLVHIAKNPRSIERITPDVVSQTLGVPAQHVPTYLALTENRQRGHARSNGAQPVATVREARRLIELYGALPDIYQHLSGIQSAAVRKKLAGNKIIFNQRYRDNTTVSSKAPVVLTGSLPWMLDSEKVKALFREGGFYSLIRLLPLPETPTRPLELANARIHSSKSNQAVINRREYNDLLERIAHSSVCAIDTEADGKDPRAATFLGISFALPSGDAFFVPFCERDMGDLTPNVVRRGLKKLFKERIMFVGHNLQYDLTLLGRNDIDPPAVCFDTLLAAHDCFGDLEFFNLPFLAQKLLGRKIKAYKDIVPEKKSFLELPFDEMKEHACTDADTALELHAFLEKELKVRKIHQQFKERTMPLARQLMNLEKEGVPVDRNVLEKIRSRLVEVMLEVKKGLSGRIGSEIDLDSREEICGLISEKCGLRHVLSRKPLTESLLEQLASGRPLLKLVVEYKRRGKQLRRVESIINAIRRGRVHPLFSQTREHDGRISSTEPDLFADDGLEGLSACLGGELATWFRDKGRSLELAQQASGDLALKKDRTGPRQSNLFMQSQATMNGLDHDDLLLRVLIGESTQQLSARFLIDQLTTNEIVRALATRYRRVFRYIGESKARGLKHGYVEREGMRRYFHGFGSSSIEKRNTAQLLACRWLLRY